MVGDYDVNVAELRAVEEIFKYLLCVQKADDQKEQREIHIFTDSNNAMNWLTEPGVHCRYYRLVQRVRRLASRLTKFRIILHWIPSHLDKHFPQFGIKGNNAADALAKAAAVKRPTRELCDP